MRQKTLILTGPLGRIFQLFLFGGVGEAVIESVTARPLNSAAGWILWVGIAVVLAVTSNT